MYTNMVRIMKKTLSSLILAVILFTGCSTLMGEEVGRLPINQISSNMDDIVLKETSVDLKKNDEIAIWSDMDVEYEGDVSLRFRIEISKDGEILDRLEIDPTDKNITVGEVRTSVMGKVDWSFSGKNHEIVIEDDGNYTFKGILVASENESLIVNKAELVLKK